MPNRDVVVIGASAGGVEALSRLCAALPADFQGSLFVVLHTAATGESRLPQVLDRAGPLVARHPDVVTRIEPGTIYVSPPNRHMVIEDDNVRLITGPRRNGYRPSINTLFESAAAAFGPGVIGVVLSGSLDDGTLGLLQIKDAGGSALVQSPDEAMFKGMPTSALEQVDVDFSGTVEDIASRIVERTGQHREEDAGDMSERSKFAKKDPNQVSGGNGNPFHITGFICPDCGGALQEERAGNFIYYRCHVGHEVSERTLLQTQGRDVESALWTALRIIEERVALGQRVEKRAIERGNVHTLNRIRSQNQEAERNAEIIRRVLQGSGSEQSITVLQDDVSGEFDPESRE